MIRRIEAGGDFKRSNRLFDRSSIWFTWEISRRLHDQFTFFYFILFFVSLKDGVFINSFSPPPRLGTLTLPFMCRKFRGNYYYDKCNTNHRLNNPPHPSELNLPLSPHSWHGILQLSLQSAWFHMPQTAAPSSVWQHSSTPCSPAAWDVQTPL